MKRVMGTLIIIGLLAVGCVKRAPAPGGTVLNVAVPAGAQPGQQIQIKAPDGRVVTVAIPAGLQPGQQFQVKV